MQAAIFRSNMMGRTSQADILKAAMDGNQWKTFGDLMSVFEATGRVKTSGAGVAYDQIANVQLENEAAKGVVGLASKALTPFKFVQNWIKDAMVGKHAAEMAKIITSPDSIEKLRALKELPPKSDRFAVGMSSLLGISPNGKDLSSNRQEESP